MEVHEASEALGQARLEILRERERERRGGGGARGEITLHRVSKRRTSVFQA